MNRTLRNVVAVVVLTAFTAIAVVATVQATGRIAGTDTATAASALIQSGGRPERQLHRRRRPAEQRPSSARAARARQSSQSTGPYGYPTSVYTPDANGLMYCPRTGCAASSCHALQ